MSRHWTELPEAHCDPVERTRRVLDEVLAERARQEAKWGECNYPSVAAVASIETPEGLCGYHGIIDEGLAKAATDAADARGECTFAHVAVEELAEALSAPDEASRREELVQLAAVAVKWIEAIDRRVAKGGG